MLNDNSTAREIEQQNANTKLHMDRLNQSLHDVTFGDMVKLMGNTVAVMSKILDRWAERRITMRTAYEIVRRIAETAMSRHGLDARKLASAARISEKSMGKLLRDEPVRLDQEQYFNLFVLGGAIELGEVMK